MFIWIISRSFIVENIDEKLESTTVTNSLDFDLKPEIKEEEEGVTEPNIGEITTEKSIIEKPEYEIDFDDVSVTIFSTMKLLLIIQMNILITTLKIISKISLKKMNISQMTFLTHQLIKLSMKLIPMKIMTILQIIMIILLMSTIILLMISLIILLKIILIIPLKIILLKMIMIILLKIILIIPLKMIMIILLKIILIIPLKMIMIILLIIMIILLIITIILVKIMKLIWIQ
jgi:hypothetical protein